MNALELIGVSGTDANYAPATDVHLNVTSGEFLVLLGMPGSGRSSLLRVVAGFGELTRGTIVYNGRDLSGTPPHRRPFTLLTEQPSLFPHKNVAGNVAYGLRRTGTAGAELRIKRALDIVDCADLADAWPRQLTSAQHQLIALARALAVEPAILLVANALNRLDPLREDRVLTRLRALQRNVGMTLVLATSDSDVAMAHADRIAVMNEGSVIETGRPDRLYEFPETATAAAMTGPINILSPDAASRLSDMPTIGPNQVCALRPEDITLYSTRPTSGISASIGRVTGTTRTARGTMVRAMLDDTGETILARLDTRRQDSDTFSTDSVVWCSWRPGSIRILRS